MTKALVVVFLLTAVATGADPQYRRGERYALLAFVRAETRDGAETVLPAVLKDNGWRDWVIDRSGVVDSDVDEGARLARKNGASITVFSEPVPRN